MDIIDRLKIEARREPHEPIWRDAIDEIAALRAATELKPNHDADALGRLERLIMLIDETDDELFDRIESLIYILGERMGADDLKSKVEDVVMNALSDIEMERKPA